MLPKADHRIPDEVFAYFPILKDFLHRRGGDLSGGQQQQLAIARALIMRPKVLLLDEPTEGIQPNIIQQIGEVLAALKAKGDMAIVLVEQYFEFAWRLADRVHVFKRGSVSLSGEKAQIDKARAAGGGVGLAAGPEPPGIPLQDRRALGGGQVRQQQMRHGHPFGQG